METKQGNVSVMGAGVSAAATAALTAVMSNPAMALVDERMSTEGTGLPFGLSNNLLGWILFGVFGLIWTFFFVYTSSLVSVTSESQLSHPKPRIPQITLASRSSDPRCLVTRRKRLSKPSSLTWRTAISSPPSTTKASPSSSFKTSGELSPTLQSSSSPRTLWSSKPLKAPNGKLSSLV